MYYGSLDGLLRARFAYSDVQWRSIIMPTQDLTWNFTPLSLTQAQIDTEVRQERLFEVNDDAQDL